MTEAERDQGIENNKTREHSLTLGLSLTVNSSLTATAEDGFGE